jgi:hypothetical protein
VNYAKPNLPLEKIIQDICPILWSAWQTREFIVSSVFDQLFLNLAGGNVAIGARFLVLY